MMNDKEINIVALEFPESVRVRTGMYLGSTDNPDVCLREIIDNATDELMGYSKCNRVDISIKSGQNHSWYVVRDNGRGIPIILDDERGITKTDLAMTVINAGSKFKNDDISIGTNGTGASAVNACCERFVVISKITNQNYDKSIPDVKYAWEHYGNPYYIVEYRKGVKVYESALGIDDIKKKYDFEIDTWISTLVAFIPDDEIWDTHVANYSKKSLSYLGVILDKFYNKSCEITVDGKTVDTSFEPYQFEFVEEVTVKWFDRTKHAKFYVNFDVDKDLNNMDSSGSINSLIVNKGLHIDWVKKAYCDALKNHYNIQHDYLGYGLKYNVICLTANMDFSSQTKERVVSIDKLYADEVLPYLRNQFNKIFAENEDYFKEHVARVNELAASFNKISAMQKVKQLVGTVEGGNRVRSKLPSSVKDAASNNRSECELFIVEGKSASGTMLKARDPKIHAILELRGVPLNAVGADLETIMDNQEMNGIVTAIGAGVNEYFNIDSCRYGKIILAADSDADGCKINSMILGFLAKKMTFLIEDGRVFIALAPLYAQGKKYVYPGENPKDIIDLSKPYSRYKGIGEVNVSEAKDFYFNENRNLIQITSNNLEYVFQLLTSSYYRKELMTRNNLITDKYNTGEL